MDEPAKRIAFDLDRQLRSVANQNAGISVTKKRIRAPPVTGSFSAAASRAASGSVGTTFGVPSAPPKLAQAPLPRRTP